MLKHHDCGSDDNPCPACAEEDAASAGYDNMDSLLGMLADIGQEARHAR